MAARWRCIWSINTGSGHSCWATEDITNKETVGLWPGSARGGVEKAAVRGAGSDGAGFKASRGGWRNVDGGQQQIMVDAASLLSVVRSGWWTVDGTSVDSGRRKVDAVGTCSAASVYLAGVAIDNDWNGSINDGNCLKRGVGDARQVINE